MVQGSCHSRACVFLIWVGLSATAGVLLAQQGPVAAMFSDDQKRGEAIALSFATAEMPPTSTATSPAQIYLTAGDLERAFDSSHFRPDSAIVPTNTDLAIMASSPATQRVLIDRVRKHPDVLRDLEEQI